jgi:alpha-mannosidase
MWCEPDGQCLGQESWVRQIIHGQRAAGEYCGKESNCGFNIDAFGFNAALPKIYKDAGIENFVTQKLRYNEFTIFPYIHFWWESDDGSRILALHAYPDHCHQIDPDAIPGFVRVFHMTDGVYNIPIMFGYGNHGGGPQDQMLDRVEHLRTLTVYPTLKYSSFGDYFDLIRRDEAETLQKLPVIRDELFLETHHKTYTVQGKAKEADRECERQLLAAEALTSVAAYCGEECSETLFHDAWQKELFNQFHDIMSGTSFPSVYQDVFDDYKQAFGQISTVKNNLTGKLLGKGDSTFVFNPLPWVRSAVVKLPADGLDENGILVDCRGNRIPYQKTSDGAEVVFVAKELPGLGFEAYKTTSEETVYGNDLKSGEDWVENAHLKASFDIRKGVINSLMIDGKEIAGDEIGRLDLLEDTKHRDYQTWNMGLTGREFNPECTSFEKIEDGPVRVVFRAKYTFGLWEKKKPYFGLILWHTPGVDYPTSFFTQDFIVYAGSNRVECVLNVDWWEDQIVLKVAAQTSLRETRAFYNIPFGAIERPTKRESEWEKARYEVPANIWADLEGCDSGLAILNRSRHGYDALDGRLRLTLLTSPWGENRSLVSDPLADRGRHTIEYAFYPHKGDYKAAEMHQYAFEYEYPAVVMKGSGQPGVKPGEGFLEVDPGKFVVTAVKPAEDGNGIIVRGFEPYGNENKVEFSGKLAGWNISRTDMLERDLK